MTDVTAESVGGIVLVLRQQRKLSRKALVEDLGGKPWTSGRLGDLEKAKHPWGYFRPVEREMLLGWLERQGVGVAELSTGEIRTPSVPVIVADDPKYNVPGIVYGPHDDPVIYPITEDDEPHLLEVVDRVAPTATSSSTVGATTPSSYDERRARVVAAYEHVHARLAGKPAPYPWPNQAYRADTAPPSEFDRILLWCQRVEQYLDDAESGRGAFAPTESAVVAGVYGSVEQLAAAAGTPATPPQPAVASGEVPSAGAPGAAAPTLVAVPTETPPATENQGVASPQAAAVGAAALYRNGLRRVTNSELQTFKHCRRRWWLSWYRGLRLQDEPQTGVRALGTRVHEALARWYVPEGETPEDPRRAFNELVEREELELLQATAHLEATNVATKLADFQKDAELGRAMLEGYVQWLAETGADVGYTVVAPEQVLTAVLECTKSLTVQLQGRLDVRLRRDQDLVHLFMDHKTVGNFTEPARRLPMDEQMKTYLLLEQANNEDGTYVDGALYNLLRRVKRTAAAKPPFYERLEVRHNPTTVDTYRERLKGEALAIDLTERMLNEDVDHHLVAYPSPSSRCTWGCEFLALCTMLDDGSRAEDFITEHYISVNPLERYDHKDTES